MRLIHLKEKGDRYYHKGRLNKSLTLFTEMNGSFLGTGSCGKPFDRLHRSAQLRLAAANIQAKGDNMTSEDLQSLLQFGDPSLSARANYRYFLKCS